MKKENMRERRAGALEEKRIEFLTALDEHITKLFEVNTHLEEIFMTASELIKLVRGARLPVWTYSNSQICKVVGDSIYWQDGPLRARNGYFADGGRSGAVIFQRK